MTPEEWKRVRKVFDAAAELPPEERPAFVKRVCGTDSHLHAEVESLLRSLEDANSFIEDSVVTATLSDLPTAMAAGRTIRPGTTIGPYLVVQVLGEGGMGTVYQAVRVDDLYRKLVAIKVVKAGLKPDYAIRQFETERQILAHLDHPNIAKLLDGGTTPDGQLYYVMDFIAGIPIDEYCDKNRLTVRDRLSLFLTVCSAVHYAHQNLIVHRDLKPQNILVSKDGAVRLLDFGIAKLLDPDQERTRDFSSTVVMLTPQYASPEQVNGEPVTTAADVYSLGVLLYHLLTGHSPYFLRSRSAQAVFETVCKSEARKPSTVIHCEEEGTTGESSSPATLTPQLVSELRGVKPDRLVRQLSGDLDNILLLALRKEPHRRYASVEQFASDIRKHLDEVPVLARPDTIRYRSVKFVRRHTAGVAAFCFFFIALLAGTAAITWESRIANLQRARAEQRFAEVRELANSVLFDIHDAIEPLPGSTSARALLVRKAQHYLDHLADDSGGDDALDRERAAAYERIGDVLGLPAKANLGDTKGALASYNTALNLERELLSRNPSDEKLQAALVRTLGRICNVEQSVGQFQNALSHCSEMLSREQALVSASPRDPARQADLAGVCQIVAGAWFAKGDWAKSESYRALALQILAKLHTQYPGNEGYETDLGNAYLRMANVQEQQRRLQPARENAEHAVAIFNTIADRHPGQVKRRLGSTYALQRLGSVLIDLGDLNGAREAFLRALPIREQLLAFDPLDASARVNLSNNMAALGYVDLRMGRAAEALRSFERQKELAEKLIATDPMRIEHRYSLSEALENTGKVSLFFAAKAARPEQKRRHLTEARASLREALRIYRELRERNAVSAEYSRVPQRIEQELAECDRAEAGQRPI